jgi:hypothetical protein
MAKRRVGKTLIAAIAFVSLLLITPVSFADSYARIVRLSETEGNVEVDRNTGQGFEKAIQNTPITQGMRIQTGQSGRAEIEFENGSTIRLANDTNLEFTQLLLRTNGDRATEVHVTDGLAYVNYRHKGDDDFRISFGNKSLNLDHDVHFRAEVTPSDARLSVFSGELKLAGDSETAKVKKNETLSLDLTDGGRYDLAKGIDPLSTDDWDKERADFHNTYASNRSSSPYSYGGSDLNYYGNYFNAPGYGTLWRPNSVGFGWDPFADGVWQWYPGYGYTWVSAYPWGWQPYRYGRWVYVPSYGWAWQPGGWNTWHSVPVVVNPPRQFKGPTPPPATSGGRPVVVGNLPPVRNPRTGDVDMIGRPNRGGRGGVHPTIPTNSINETRGGKTSVPAANTPAGNTQTAAPATVQTNRPVTADRDNAQNRDGLGNKGSRHADVPDSLRTPRSAQPAPPATATQTPAAAPAKTAAAPPAPARTASPPAAVHSAPAPPRAAPSAPRSMGGAPHMSGGSMGGGPRMGGGGSAPRPSPTPHK